MKNKKDEPSVKAAGKQKEATKPDITSVSEDDIRRRAYEIYLNRGGLYAPPEADWLQAEAELRNSIYKKKREEDI